MIWTCNDPGRDGLVKAVPPIEGNRISGQKGSPQGSHGSLTGREEQMEMIPVGVVFKDLRPLDPPGDDVMQSFRCTNSCKNKGRP